VLVKCKGNAFLGELVGPELHPELANCRYVRFDIPSYSGKLIYCNEPADGAPAECRWPTVAPRADLRAQIEGETAIAGDLTAAV
jgi:hypothetical protein